MEGSSSTQPGRMQTPRTEGRICIRAPFACGLCSVAAGAVQSRWWRCSGFIGRTSVNTAGAVRVDKDRRRPAATGPICCCCCCCCFSFCRCCCCFSFCRCRCTKNAALPRCSAAAFIATMLRRPPSFAAIIACTTSVPAPRCPAGGGGSTANLRERSTCSSLPSCSDTASVVHTATAAAALLAAPAAASDAAVSSCASSFKCAASRLPLTAARSHRPKFVATARSARSAANRRIRISSRVLCRQPAGTGGAVNRTGVLEPPALCKNTSETPSPLHYEKTLSWHVKWRRSRFWHHRPLLPKPTKAMRASVASIFCIKDAIAVAISNRSWISSAAAACQPPNAWPERDWPLFCITRFTATHNCFFRR